MRRIKSTAAWANGRDVTLAALGFQNQLRPLRERQATLLEVVMSIVGSLDTLELVT